ncbi:MAG: hypothetical protein LBR54_04440 [Oscillospiraceae bacterium]|jgi:membrane protease subunit (stomatin/prohibitin family)|nr:hypothetical protein [Oscillospiraceae bacterium]
MTKIPFALEMSYYDSYYTAEMFVALNGSIYIENDEPLSVPDEFKSEIKAAMSSVFTGLSEDGAEIPSGIFDLENDRIKQFHGQLNKYMKLLLGSRWKTYGIFEENTVIYSLEYDSESKKLIAMKKSGLLDQEKNFSENVFSPPVGNRYSNPNPQYHQGYNQMPAPTSYMPVPGPVPMQMHVPPAPAPVPLQNPVTPNFMPGPAQIPEPNMTRTVPDFMPGSAQIPEPNMTQTVPNLITWRCGCGCQNSGNFCQNCGHKCPAPPLANQRKCSCGSLSTGSFCPNCGNRM